MKKLFLLAATAMLMSGGVALANGGSKNAKNSNKKARTEKTCPKGCCDKGNCCDKGKCTKS